MNITYKFDFPDGQTQSYELNFDEKSMKLINPNPSKVDWAKLDNHKCSHCPLDPKRNEFCPIAQNLESVATHFAEDKSFKETTISVITAERTFIKKASLQEGLQGIFGLIMATSGCPHLDFLRPMARFHLPFATYIETMVRSTSFYLLRQYFNLKDKKPADFEMKALEAQYADINKVNQGIVVRIRSISKGDADRNAVVILDGFASLLSMELSGDMGEVRQAIEY